MKRYNLLRDTFRGPNLVVVADSDPEVIGEYVLTPYESQKVYNHSPDGFEWGYSGSGPAQLALAILLDYFSYLSDDDKIKGALRYYQSFKDVFISTLSQKELHQTIKEEDIENYLCMVEGIPL